MSDKDLKLLLELLVKLERVPNLYCPLKEKVRKVRGSIIRELGSYTLKEVA